MGWVLAGLGGALAIGGMVLALGDNKEQAGPVIRAAVAPSQNVVLGVNLGAVPSWGMERSFANLVAGGEWHSRRDGQPWTAMPEERLDASGALRGLEPGETGALSLAFPAAVRAQDVRIRCTWSGAAQWSVNDARDARQNGQRLDFTWRKGASPALILERMVPQDPVRELDCRERDLAAGMVFHPEFVASLAPFRVVRFLDWQRTNDNKGGRWDARTLPSSFLQHRPDGATIEHMVSLANEAGVDPWFLMPWDADERYVVEFAELVRARLAPERRVYVELGNEIWNTGFAAARAAGEEGVRLGYHADPNMARPRRYAERARRAMDIWSRAFANERERLVRVIAWQHVSPESSANLLKQPGVAGGFDAFATAPYFGHEVLADNQPARDLDSLFRLLEAELRSALDYVTENKALATRHGLRYLAYEGGQHLQSHRSADLATALNRDPRMGVLYAQYIAGWRARAGDALLLYNSVAPFTTWGNWGLSEYLGQPLAEAHKRRAVEEASAAGRQGNGGR